MPALSTLAHTQTQGPQAGSLVPCSRVGEDKVSLCLLSAQAELRKQIALCAPVLNIPLVFVHTAFVIDFVSGFKSVISDSFGFKRTNKEGPGELEEVVWLRRDRGLGGRVGPRAGEGATNGKTRKWDICAFCLFWLL